MGPKYLAGWQNIVGAVVGSADRQVYKKPRPSVNSSFLLGPDWKSLRNRWGQYELYWKQIEKLTKIQCKKLYAIRCKMPTEREGGYEFENTN